jgi:hypothetical protein
MSLEQNQEHHNREVPDRYVDPVGSTYQMRTFDYVVRPAPTDDGSITVTLPPVAEAKGRWYSIILANAGTVVVADKDDSEYWPGDITLGDEGDSLLLYSDGRAWITRFSAANAPS